MASVHRIKLNRIILIYQSIGFLSPFEIGGPRKALVSTMQTPQCTMQKQGTDKRREQRREWLVGMLSHVTFVILVYEL